MQHWINIYTFIDSNTGRRSSSGSSNDQPTSNKPSKGNGGGIKRKEQNRAAQRAFRERKEKHVKDLEDKVNQQAEENSNLRDQKSWMLSQITAYIKISLRLG